MKAKVNTATGCVAVIANEHMGTRRKGQVFGVLAKDAATLLGKGAVRLVPEANLPKDANFETVEINVEERKVIGPVDEEAPKRRGRPRSVPKEAADGDDGEGNDGGEKPGDESEKDGE